jgi:molybdenum cofactor cytidylyltransferase
MQTFALIPAAGKSTRMGRPKLALPLGDGTVLECTVSAVRRAGITETLVVVNPQGAELAALAEKADAHVLELSEDTPDMQSTVMLGLAWLEDHYLPQPTDSCLLLPADHPALNAQVIRELLHARTARPECSIFIPTHEGRRGHPTLIGWLHVAELRAWPAGLGLNRFLRQKADAVCEWPVDAPEIRLDLDTPEDYERLLETYRYFKEM